MALRAVGTDRLALALRRAEPADEPGPEQQPDDERGGARRARAEADVADQVEDAGEAELLGDYVEHASPFATRSTSLASPIELLALTSTASPGRSRRISDSVASSTVEARSMSTAPQSASDSGRMSSPIRIRRSTRAPTTAGARPAWSASACSPSSRIAPNTAIRRLASSSSPRL